MASTERLAAEFSVGHVLSQSFGLLFTRLHRYALLALVLNLPDLAGNLYLQPKMLALAKGGPVQPGQLGNYFSLLGGSFLVAVLVTSLGQAVLIHGAWHELRRQPVGLGAMLSRGFARWLVLIAFSLVLYVLVFVGALFLLFPALIIMVMGFVGATVCVIESGGPFHGLTRSIDLTEGHRWKVFVLLLLLLLVTVGGALILQAMLGRATTPSLLVQFVWQALAIALTAIVTAATYLDLRIAKEGGEIDRLAAVFD